MIYAIYLNPTIDKTVYLDELKIGGTNRPDTVLTQGGGKALNLAVVASRLGAEAAVSGFLCSEGCSMIRSALSGIPCYFIEQHQYENLRSQCGAYHGNQRSRPSV